MDYNEIRYQIERIYNLSLNFAARSIDLGVNGKGYAAIADELVRVYEKCNSLLKDNRVDDLKLFSTSSIFSFYLNIFMESLKSCDKKGLVYSDELRKIGVYLSGLDLNNSLPQFDIINRSSIVDQMITCICFENRGNLFLENSGFISEITNYHSKLIDNYSFYNIRGKKIKYIDLSIKEKNFTPKNIIIINFPINPDKKNQKVMLAFPVEKIHFFLKVDVGRDIGCEDDKYREVWASDIGRKVYFNNWSKYWRITDFEQFLELDDKLIQLTLRAIENEQLVKSLKGASPQVKFKFYNNMSNNAIKIIEDEIVKLGSIPISEIELEQQKMVDIVNSL